MSAPPPEPEHEGLDSVGEVMHRAEAIAKAGDKAGAARLLTQLEAYIREHGESLEARDDPRESARQLLGYVSGYFKPDTGQAILEVFDVEHPVFGRASPDWLEAYLAGAADAEADRSRPDQ